MKELWIDRDDCFIWFDAKPMCDALGHGFEDSGAIAVELSDEDYTAYQKHCADLTFWQNKFENLYLTGKWSKNER